MASQAFCGALWRDKASEGSLPPTGRAALAQSGYRGTTTEGKSMSLQTWAVGNGWGVMLKGE